MLRWKRGGEEMEPFDLISSAEVPYFALSHWERDFPHLTVGCSSKKNDVNWTHSNYALHVGKDKEQVVENRKKLVQQIGMPFSSWTSGEQVHDTQIAIVTQVDRGRGNLSRESAFFNTDGLMTEEVNILLTTYYADCVPLYFYSPDIDMIATVHAGWKGTVGSIVGKVIEMFIQRGAKIENMRAAIGPSIGSCCYEVDEKVIDPLKAVILSEDDLRTVTEEQDQEMRWKLNLKKANKILMERVGVLPEHISVSSWCTSCYPDYFHSHRRDAGDTGRMVAWIGKRERN